MAENYDIIEENANQKKFHSLAPSRIGTPRQSIFSTPLKNQSMHNESLEMIELKSKCIAHRKLILNKKEEIRVLKAKIDTLNIEIKNNKANFNKYTQSLLLQITELKETIRTQSSLFCTQCKSVVGYENTIAVLKKDINNLMSQLEYSNSEGIQYKEQLHRLEYEKNIICSQYETVKGLLNGELCPNMELLMKQQETIEALTHSVNSMLQLYEANTAYQHYISYLAIHYHLINPVGSNSYSTLKEINGLVEEIVEVLKSYDKESTVYHLNNK